MRDDSGGRRARLIVPRVKRAAKSGDDAEHIEEVRRDDGPLDLLGFAGSREVPAAGNPAADRVEAAGLRPQVVEVRSRERELRLVVLGFAAPDENEALLVFERQGIEDDPVQDREHRGHAADPDRQRQDGDERQ